MTSLYDRARDYRPAGVALLFIFGFGATATVGCQAPEDEECVSLEQYFKEEIWAPVMSQKCITCHSSTGVAKDSQFVLQSSDWTGYLEANLATIERLAKLEYEGEPWLIVKPTATVEHGGGEQFARGSAEYDAFVELVERIQNPVECEDTPIGAEYLAGVTLLDEVETLRKASLNLAGRLPTAEEEAAVAAGGLEALDLALADLLHEDDFYARLVEIYNDHLLTDRYLPGSDAIDLLDGADYPNSYWFEDIADDDERNLARRRSNRAIAREVVELIAYVVRNDRPFTEILTADYVVVNPWSAQVYGVNPDFENPGDTNEWREAKLPGIPHAGILTSHIFLNRFPTTPTNRNRHRSRMIFKFFLATDVLALAERPIASLNIEDFNPTRESEACTVCHANIDPIGGTLQNWDTAGRYRPPEEGWYPEMFQPGFGDAELPGSDKNNATQWLTKQIIEDPRFAASQVNIVFEGLIGREPLGEPNDPNAYDYLGKLVAFDAENTELLRIADLFTEADFDLRVVFMELVKSPYFRAEDFDPSASGEEPDSEEAAARLSELSVLGTARWLTPEMLDRKIQAVTGYPWQRSLNNSNYLLGFDEYRIFFGGIDSDTIIERMTVPNGIMTSVSSRMANEVACWNTARDFTKPAASRNLLPYVEPGFEPEDENGFEIPASSEAIRANIQYLHWQLLGERIELDAPEVDQSYALFLEVWRDGKRGMGLGEYTPNLPGDCQATVDFWSDQPLSDAERITQDPNYTIRAWMAVMTYMLSDYRFLHE